MIFLTVGDSARIAECTPARIVQAANAGKIPVAARTERGNRLFLREDVLAFARARGVRSGEAVLAGVS